MSNVWTGRLDTNQQVLVEAKLANEKKSVGVAYLLWFLLGGVGAHNFYIERPGVACLEIVLSVAAWTVFVTSANALLFLPLVALLLYDVFNLGQWVRQDTEERRQRLAKEIRRQAGAAQ